MNRVNESSSGGGDRAGGDAGPVRHGSVAGEGGGIPAGINGGYRSRTRGSSREPPGSAGNRLREKVEAIPRSPGVYIFRNASGEVIYVGKARALRDRLKSYLQAPPRWDTRGAALRAETADLEVAVCAGEIEALILEARLIKHYRPRFNVVLRDDKTYPSIAVTVSEEFPRVILARGSRTPGTSYYGPYVNARAARKTLELLRKVFPLRQCRGSRPGRKGAAPCLYRQMELCPGPCTGEVSREDYAQVVKSLCAFLEGRHREVLEGLEREMHEAAGRLEFEKAARLRNQLESARRVLSHRGSGSSSADDYDVLGIAQDRIQAAFIVAMNRGGSHIGNVCHFSNLEQEWDRAELLAEFIKYYYDLEGSPPPLVVVPVLPADEVLPDWLSALAGRKVRIRLPERGGKKRELALAAANATLALEKAVIDRSGDREKLDLALREIARELDLDSYPLRIECFDISTMGGIASVGSMVVFQDGLPRRSAYRRYSIRFIAGVDDTGMMREVLTRRFSRMVDEPEDEGAGTPAKPDLVLLDGGKGQLGACLEVFRELGIEGIGAAALAKRLEQVYLPGRPEPVILPEGSEGLFLLQRLRDEAHRFAVTYHRSRMHKRTAESWLDEVAGVGPGRKKAIIRAFGSPRGVIRAEREDIRRVPGLPRAVADSVYEAARKMEEGPPPVDGAAS